MPSSLSSTNSTATMPSTSTSKLKSSSTLMSSSSSLEINDKISSPISSITKKCLPLSATTKAFNSFCGGLNNNINNYYNDGYNYNFETHMRFSNNDNQMSQPTMMMQRHHHNGHHHHRHQQQNNFFDKFNQNQNHQPANIMTLYDYYLLHQKSTSSSSTLSSTIMNPTKSNAIQ